jgi:hypothetical protein
MRIRMIAFGATTLFAMCTVPVTNPASAMSIDKSIVIDHAGVDALQFVQYQRRGSVRYHGHGHGGDGAGVAAGVLGGIILGGMLAAPGYYGYAQSPYYDGYSAQPPEAYCMRRYRSYDPSSGTYLGYDGYRHPCP